MSSPPESNDQNNKERMDPQIMEKLLFHRSYKAAPMSATQLAKSSRALDKEGTNNRNDRNRLTNTGTAIMSSSGNHGTAGRNGGWYISSGDTPEEQKYTGEIPIIMVDNLDEVLSRSQQQRSAKLPPRLGRGYHIERMAAARRGEKYHHPQTKPPHQKEVKDEERKETKAQDEKDDENVQGKVKQVAGTKVEVTEQKTKEGKHSEKSSNQQSEATKKKQISNQSSTNNSTTMGKQTAKSTLRGGSGGGGSRALVKTPEPLLRQQRKEIQAMRLKVDLLWDELYVPSRDRQAVLKAMVKNETDAIALLSGHLHVLLAHKKNTMAVIDVIREREEILASLISKCDEDFLIAQKRKNEREKQRNEAEKQKKKPQHHHQVDGQTDLGDKKTTPIDHYLARRSVHSSHSDGSVSSSLGHNGGNPTKKKTVVPVAQPLDASMLKVPNVIKSQPSDGSSLEKGAGIDGEDNGEPAEPLEDDEEDLVSALSTENATNDNGSPNQPKERLSSLSNDYEDQNKEEGIESGQDGDLSVEELYPLTSDEPVIEQMGEEFEKQNDQDEQDSNPMNTTAFNKTLRDIDENNVSQAMQDDTLKTEELLSLDQSSSSSSKVKDASLDNDSQEDQEEDQEEDAVLRDLLAQLVLVSTQTVQAILEWRTSLWRPLPFSFRGHKNYLIKMCNDVQFFLKDSRTSAKLEALLKQVQCEAALGVLFPLETSFFKSAPELDYVKCVTSMTLNGSINSSNNHASVAAGNGGGSGAHYDEQANQATTKRSENDLKSDQNLDVDESQQQPLTPSLSMPTAASNVLWNVAQILSMEKMIMEQVEVEAKIRRQNKSFIPLLKPISAFQASDESASKYQDQQGTNQGIDLHMSSIEDHPHHPLEPPKPFPFNQLTSPSKQGGGGAGGDFLTNQSSSLVSSQSASRTSQIAGKDTETVKENSCFDNTPATAALPFTVFSMNMPIVSHVLFPEHFSEPPLPQPLLMNDSSIVSSKSSNIIQIDISNFTPEQVLQLQLQQQRRSHQVPKFSKFPTGHGTSTAEGSSVGFGSSIGNTEEEGISFNDDDDRNSEGSKEGSAILDVGFGDVFGGGSYGRNGELHSTPSHNKKNRDHKDNTENDENDDDNLEEGLLEMEDFGKDVDYDEILLSKVREDRDIISHVQRLIPREMSDNIHMAVTTALINNVFIQADESDAGILHVKELHPVVLKLALSLVHFDRGELGSFVENSVSLAQCLLYARVYDENCMITQEDFPDYLRTLLVMCWVSTLPDHGINLLKHCQSMDNHGSGHPLSSSKNHGNSLSHASFDSKWMEEDEVELNKRLPKHIEAHWSRDYGQYYFYDSTSDVTTWECPIGNLKKHSSSNVLSQIPKEETSIKDSSNASSPLLYHDGSDGMLNHSEGFSAPSPHHPPNSQPGGDNNYSNAKSNDSSSSSVHHQPMISVQEESREEITPCHSINADTIEEGNVDKLKARILELEAKLEKVNLQNSSQNSATTKNKENGESIEKEEMGEAVDDFKTMLGSPTSNNPSNFSPTNSPNKSRGIAIGGRDVDDSKKVINERELTFNTVNSDSLESPSSNNEERGGLLGKLAKHKVHKLPSNLSMKESEYLLDTFMNKAVHGLNLSSFHAAVNHCMLDLPGTTFTKEDLPRVKDMDKAFQKADVDKSGVVDFKEFLELYGKIKAGEVDGLAGYGLFEWKRKKTPKNKVRPVSS